MNQMNTAVHPWVFFYERFFCLPGCTQAEEVPTLSKLSKILAFSLILYCDGENLKAGFAFKNVGY